MSEDSGWESEVEDYGDDLEQDVEESRKEHAFAVDVGWLRELDDEPRDYSKLELAIHLVDFVKAKDADVLFDFELGIEGEYRRVLRAHSVGWAIGEALRPFQSFRSSTPTIRASQQLDLIDFDPADRKYVGVAQHGQGIFVTHESKHVVPSVRDAVRAGCGVEIFDRPTLRAYLDRNFD